jgi:hypothetical protein
VDRVQYIIITNTPSLYTMVMYGKGISDDGEFIDGALSHLGQFMPSDGKGATPFCGHGYWQSTGTA